MVRATLLAVALLCSVSSGAGNPPDRPKIYGISFVRFKAVDFEKSTAFYSKNLGLRSASGDCKDLPRPCFLVNSWQHVELTQAASNDGAGFLDEVGFATSDLGRMHAYLSAHGVKCTEISRGPNGIHFFELTDPEGNRLAFTERSSGGAFTDSPNQVSHRLLHAGFVVKDLAAENRFYLDLLGFRLYWYGGFKDVDRSAGAREKDLSAVPSTKDTDWYEIQVPDGDNWIEYMLNIPATADHKELGVQNHFSLGVAKIQPAAAKLHANGLLSFDGPEIGRDGKWGLDAYDPDANRVEFMEFTPAKDPCCHPYSAPHAKP